MKRFSLSAIFLTITFFLHVEIYAADFSCEDVKADIHLAESAVQNFYSDKKKILIDEFTSGKMEEHTFIKRAEALSLNLYSGSEYNHVNRELRSGEFHDFETFALILCSALNKISSYQGKVYRVGRLSPEIINLYVVGKPITEKAFLSTSKTKSGIRSFVGVQTMNAFFEIKSLTGKDISMFSGRPEEQEILFPAGSKFVVRKVKRGASASKTTIWMDQVLK